MRNFYLFLAFGFFTISAHSNSICGSTIRQNTSINDSLSCTKGITINGVTLAINTRVVLQADLNIQNGGSLRISETGELIMDQNAKILLNDKNSTVVIESGGIVQTSALLSDVKKGDITVDGYLEIADSGSISLETRKIKGKGIIYLKKSASVSLLKGAKIMGMNGVNTSDTFLFSAKQITAKRATIFKVQVDGLTLGNDFEVGQYLELNGRNIDIGQYNLSIPQKALCNRRGKANEYIKTSNTGKFRITIPNNKKNFTAPIGRNPYLPVTINCDDCAGTTFSISVSEGSYLNPSQRTGLQNANSVGETWTIIPDRAINSKVQITLQWNAGEDGTVNSELTGFDREKSTAVYWLEGTSNSWQNDGINVNTQAQGSGPFFKSIQLDSMKGGSAYYFGVASKGSALPVELIYFEPANTNKGIALKWATATEINCREFEVQHSDDAINWQVLNVVNCSQYSMENKYYEYLHENPPFGVNYYRLRQVDHDEAFEYSGVRQAFFGSENTTVDIGLYPNPATDLLTITLNTPLEADVYLFQSNGTLISQAKVDQTLSLDISHLERGFYYIRTYSKAKGWLKTQRFIKH